jgi:hypothetical protein
MRSLVLLVLLLAAHGAPAFECIRGEPEPALPAGKPGIVESTFTPRSSTEALEVVRFDDGAQVRIEHGGCEYYLATLEIRDPSLHADGSDVPAAYRAAAAWLRRLAVLEPALGFDFVLAAKKLERMPGAKRDLAFDEDIRVDGDGTDFLQTQVAVVSASRDDQVGTLRIRLFKGPL